MPQLRTEKTKAVFFHIQKTADFLPPRQILEKFLWIRVQEKEK